jgi:hypothetical protein
VLVLVGAVHVDRHQAGLRVEVPLDPRSSPKPLAPNGTLCRGRDAAKRELV